MPYYFYRKCPIWNLNAILYWKLAQLLLGGIIFDKLKSILLGVLSYFYTGVPTPNKQPFLFSIILSPYFYLDLSLHNFSYIPFYFYYSYVASFNNKIKFEFNLFLICKYFKILVYYLISILFLYQMITLIFLNCTVMFSIIFVFPYYITFCFYHF